MKLSVAQSAIIDLQQIHQYYSELGVPQVGREFITKILSATERLLDHPDSGRKVPEYNQEQLREIILPPYRIVYLREIETVSLIRVWRSERLLVLPQID